VETIACELATHALNSFSVSDAVPSNSANRLKHVLEGIDMKTICHSAGNEGSLTDSMQSGYRLTLLWTFTFFSAIRVIAYLPTIWAIWVSGDASQHSIFTWLIWFGANLTMAAWLYEHSRDSCGRAILINVCNAFMCGIIAVLIAVYQWQLLPLASQ
jgi:hypothetical protein